MQELFSEEFAQADGKEVFTIYQLNVNLYQAKGVTQIIILWKVNNIWEGVSNSGDAPSVGHIGASIDSFLLKAASGSAT